MLELRGFPCRYTHDRHTGDGRERLVDNGLGVCECVFLASAHFIITCSFSFRFSDRFRVLHLHHMTGQVCTGHSDSYKHAERDGECSCVRSLVELSDRSLLFDRVDEGQNSTFDAGGDTACD